MEATKENLKIIRVQESAHQTAKICAANAGLTLQNYIELLITTDAMKRKAIQLSKQPEGKK